MMEGITVLNSYPNDLTGLGIFLYVMIAIGFALSMIFLCCGIHDRHTFAIVAGSIFIVIFLVLTGAATHKCFIKEPDIYYQVTLDENVSYLEFTERYEIIKQEGKIYTIKDK